jgi:hypothetical protein
MQVHTQRLDRSLNVHIQLILRVIDKVIPRLSHINPAVVFGCIKLIVRYLDYLSG